MQDMIISAISDYKKNNIKHWVNSINRSGFTGRKVMVVHNILDETLDYLDSEGFEILLTSDVRNKQNNGFHFVEKYGNRVTVSRHWYNWKFLKDQTDVRYVISCDIDIIFQSNPSEWLEQNLGDKKLNYGCEALLYKDEPWGNDNLMRCFGPEIHETMKNNPIYNAGSMAGECKTLADFSLNVFKTIERIPNDVPDQAGVNFLLNLEPYKSITKFNDHDTNWACQLGTTASPQKIDYLRPKLISPEPVFDGQHIYNSKGEKYCLVHQYNKVPEWQAKLEQIYG